MGAGYDGLTISLEVFMKRILVSLFLLLSLLPFAQTSANNFIQQEAMLLLLAAVSAEEPEIAATVDALALLTISGSSDYQTDTQRIIAYVGLGALAIYNYEAEDEDYSKKDIFAVNFVVFNIVLAGQLFGLNDSTGNFRDADASGSSFNFGLSQEGDPRVNWLIKFD